MREVRQGSLLQGAVVPLRALCALCAGMWSGRAAIRRRAQQCRARPVLEARGRSRSPRARARAHTQGLRSSATAAAPRATRRWCWCRHQRAQAGRVAGMEGGWPARRSRRSGRRASGGIPPNGARSAAGASRGVFLCRLRGRTSRGGRWTCAQPVQGRARWEIGRCPRAEERSAWMFVHRATCPFCGRARRVWGSENLLRTSCASARDAFDPCGQAGRATGFSTPVQETGG